MAQIKINDNISVVTTEGVIQNSGTVLCIQNVQYVRPNNIVKVLYKAYKSIDAESNGALELHDVLSHDQILTIDKDKLVKGLIPIMIEELKTKYNLTNIEDLVILNREWDTIDDKGNEISELRTIRVFLTWRQAALLAQDYNELVQTLIANQIPTVSDTHGKYIYFEWIDDPATGTHDIENLLISLGAIIQNKEI